MSFAFQDRYVGRGSGLHLARSIHEFSQSTSPPSEHFEEHTSPSLVELMLQEEHRRHSNLFPLPPPDLAEKLIDAYFENFNTIICVLHRPHLERKLQSGLLESDPSFRSLCKIPLRSPKKPDTDSQCITKHKQTS
jgi:hypothetical protein